MSNLEKHQLIYLKAQQNPKRMNNKNTISKEIIV